ncbi:MAG: ABC-2 family transporter protein [Chloroflexi bacterium]|nr:ABC-2 family transporter protein [Chloroflexota bacterium]
MNERTQTPSAGTVTPSAVARPRAEHGLVTGRRGSWRKYAVAFRTSVQSQLAYPGELWMRTIFLVLIMFIFSSLWHTTYGELGRSIVGGFSLTQMLWYLAITESLMLSRPRGSIRIAEEIRTGDFAYSLIRPYNFVLFRYAQAMGDRVVKLAVNVVVAMPLALLFSGGLGLDARALIPGVVVVVAAITLDFLMVLILHLLALWVEDTGPFEFIYDRLLMILGGMLLPIALFPDRLEAVARALPFSSVINGPAQTLVSFDAGEAAFLMIRQGAAVLVVGAAAVSLFRLGVRQVHSNGG